MEYNKTKRGIEKAAGILSVVVYSISIIGSIIMISYGGLFLANSYEYYYSADIGLILSLLGVFYMAISIFSIILSAILIRDPIDENGNLIDRKVLRITMIILSFLGGSLIVAGLLIAVLCQKDFVSKPKIQPNIQTYSQPSAPSKIEEKLAQIKNLKELGVIDEVTYKKAVQKVFNEYLKN